MLNEAFILRRIEPYLNSKRELSEFEFTELFAKLTLQEQYEIVQIMIANNIEYVDEKEEEACLLNKVAYLRQNESTKDFKGLLSLTNEELCIMAQRGEQIAAAAIIEKNKRFVYKIALKLYGRFSQTCLTVDDLYQEGNVGLIDAIDRFDPLTGYKFTTYSWFWIRQRILRSAIGTGYLIRIPDHQFEKLMKLYACRKKNPWATSDELVEIMGSNKYTQDEILYLIKLTDQYLNTASLNSLVGGDGDAELIEFIPDENTSLEDTVSKDLLKEEIMDVLDTLTPREEKVLRLRFGLDDGCSRTLEEVGKEFAVTRERIRQIEVKALRKLRHPSRSKKLRDFL